MVCSASDGIAGVCKIQKSTGSSSFELAVLLTLWFYG